MSPTKVIDFLKREKMKSLALAEKLALEQGSYSKFVGSYSECRRYSDIGSSIESALKQQNLWDQFVKTVDSKF